MRTRGGSWHFINFIVQCNIQRWPSVIASPQIWLPLCSSRRFGWTFTLFFRLLTGQHNLTLRAYMALNIAWQPTYIFGLLGCARLFFFFFFKQRSEKDIPENTCIRVDEALGIKLSGKCWEARWNSLLLEKLCHLTDANNSQVSVGLDPFFLPLVLMWYEECLTPSQP